MQYAYRSADIMGNQYLFYRWHHHDPWDDAGLMPPSKNCSNSGDNHTNLKEGWWNSHLEHLCHLLYRWKQDLCILSLLITMPHVYFWGPQHIRLCTNTNVMPRQHMVSSRKTVSFSSAFNSECPCSRKRRTSSFHLSGNTEINSETSLQQPKN